MQLLRLSLLICLMTLSAFTFSYGATIPYQDQELVNKFNQQNIRLIVIRHGEAVHNLKDLMSSTRSPGVYLTEKGIGQVQHSATQLLAEKIEKIYASPVFRTLQTAQIVGKTLSIPYENMLVEERLREQFFGDFEGRTYHEYIAYFSSPEDVFIKAAPGGESGSESFARTQDFLWEIATNHQDETILLVTHAFNCSLISKCLTGSHYHPQQAEYKVYDFGIVSH